MSEDMGIPQNDAIVDVPSWYAEYEDEYAKWRIEIAGSDEEALNAIKNGRRIALEAIPEADPLYQELRDEAHQVGPLSLDEPDSDEPPDLQVIVSLLWVKSSGPHAIRIAFDPPIHIGRKHYWVFNLSEVPLASPFVVYVQATPENGARIVASKREWFGGTATVKGEAGNPADYNIINLTGSCFTDHKPPRAC